MKLNKENWKNIIDEHFKQEGLLPIKIKTELETNRKEKVRLYAFTDFNSDLESKKTWLVLGSHNLYAFKIEGENFIIETCLSLEKVVRIRSSRGLSCHELRVYVSDDMPSALELFYSSRQKAMMDQMIFCLEQITKNQSYDLLVDPDEQYQMNILRPLLEVSSEVGTKDKDTLWRLLEYLLPYKRELVLGSIGAITGTAVSLLPPYLSGYAIDKIVRPFQDGTLSFDEARSMAWLVFAGLGLSYVVKEVFIWLRLKKMAVLGEKVAFDLRGQLYEHLQSLDVEFFGKKPTGSLISRVSSDTDRIWDFIAFGVVEVSIAIVTLLGLSGVLLLMDFQLGLIMILPVPLLLLSIYFHGEKMKKMFLGAWGKWSKLTELLSDTIPGIQVVKAFGQEAHEVKRFRRRNKAAVEGFNEIHKKWTSFWPRLMMGIHFTVLTVWIFAIPRLVSSGAEDTISAGTFVSFLLYMTMFSAPIEVIGQVARMLNRALSSAHRIFEILDAKPKITTSKRAKKLNVSGAVEFKKVRFSYDGVRPILKGVSFKISPGEMIGLVGPSGGGKSTITKLINRFYDIDDGQVIIDGVPLKELDLTYFRKQVAMVLQDPYLFHGSIWENIAYGQENVDKFAVIEAAKVANAHDFIMALPQGYETVVGERGHTLSGGERQRISIARAVLQNPKILILDEATSALDSETEEKIQEALDRLSKGRTVIAIAHRLSTLRQADRIFVIEKGELKEEGSHQELLEVHEGIYKKLYDVQMKMSKSFV
ncbi:MAG: ABC transporter ATP-binding protein [Bacteriovoracaceae bacterium]